jgi:hypothetical protein
MTLETFIRAQLVAFAYQQVGETGSVNSLKAVCYVMTNRLKAGWSNDLLELIDQAPEHSAHPTSAFCGPPPLKAGSAQLQGLLRDIDDVFYATADDETRKIVCPIDPKRKPLLYWQNLLNGEVRPWFQENIARSHDHPRKAQVGMIVLYE